MRIVHISDLHFWHITLDLGRLFSKRFLGMGNLILNRARHYRMETMGAVIERIRSIAPDHLLITGDLTTTSLNEEFELVRRALDPLDPTPATLSVIPGNHDRYTREAARLRVFERYFGEFAPAPEYPWFKRLPEDLGILAFDPTRPNRITAEGTVNPEDVERAAALLNGDRPRRLLVACHYPVALPVGIVEGRGHGLRGIELLREFLRRMGPNLYCHGHVHASWAFVPQSMPTTLCIDAGATLKRRRAGVSASMVEIVVEGEGVEVRRHRLRLGAWESDRLAAIPAFFSSTPVPATPARPR